MPTEQYLATALLVLVSLAAVNDLATRRIPNRLLLIALAVAMILRLLSATPGTSLWIALCGLVAGLALFLPFYLLRGMAAGDVKLMAVIGAFTGPDKAFQIAVLTWCFGGVMALAVVLARGRLRLVLGNVGGMFVKLVPSFAARVPEPQQSVGTLPYGVAIAAGTMVFLVRSYG
jgi:prepilin peptidase CpaA